MSATCVCMCVNTHTVMQVLYTYLDNRSAVGVTTHNTSGSLTSLVFPQLVVGVISAMVEKELGGKGTLALTP